MTESRKNSRLRQQMDISWSIEESKISGKGKVYNVSLSGLRFETDRAVKPKLGTIFTIKSDKVPFPAKAKLKWSKILPNQKGYLCGVVFALNGMEYSPEWKKWIQDNMGKLASAEDSNIAENYLGLDES